MTVYLVHFAVKYKRVQHYMGFTDDLPNRERLHRSGHGARLMQVITLAGISWSVVRTWRGDRKLERKLKNSKNLKRYCPVCNPGKKMVM